MRLSDVPLRTARQQAVVAERIAELYCEPCPEAVDILVVTAAVCILLVLTARAAHISEGDLQIAVARTYPVEAANVIEKRSYTGPLYNHLGWLPYLASSANAGLYRRSNQRARCRSRDSLSRGLERQTRLGVRPRAFGRAPCDLPDGSPVNTAPSLRPAL